MKKILCGLALCIGTSLFAQTDENSTTAFNETIKATASVHKSTPPAKKAKAVTKPTKNSVVSADRVAIQRARFKEMLESVTQTKIKSSLTELKDEKQITATSTATAMKEEEPVPKE